MSMEANETPAQPNTATGEPTRPDAAPPAARPKSKTRPGKETAGELDACRHRRLTAAALNIALADKQCRHCGTRGAWDVYNRDPVGRRTRYIRCRGCGKNAQVPVIMDDADGREGGRT